MDIIILPAKTKNLFNKLRAKKFISRFYLAGGTAVALHYQHRHSQDLDFFTTIDFRTSVLKKNLSALGKIKVFKQEQGTLIGEMGGTKISFFILSEKLLRPTTNIGEIRIAHPLDLALMKIMAVSDRGTKRDFFDLYVLCHNLIPLRQLFSYLPKKYGRWNYNLNHIIRSLSYFADAEKDPRPRMLIDLSWKEVKDFFKEETKNITKSLL